MLIKLPKTFDEIEKPILMDEDFYNLRIVKEQTIVPNGVLKGFVRALDKKPKTIDEWMSFYKQAVAQNYTDEEGKYPGFNILLNLRVVHEDPMINGRGFRRWIGLPMPEDKERVTPNGQTIEDFKMEQIRAELDAYGIEPDDEGNFEIPVGAMAAYYITSQPNFRDPETIENTIDMNVKPQPAM